MNRERGEPGDEALALRSEASTAIAAPSGGGLARRALELVPSLRERRLTFPADSYLWRYRRSGDNSVAELIESIDGVEAGTAGTWGLGRLTITQGEASRTVWAAGEVVVSADAQVELIVALPPTTTNSYRPWLSEPVAEKAVKLQSFLSAMLRLDPWSIDKLAIFNFADVNLERKSMLELFRAVSAQKSLRSVALEATPFALEEDLRHLLRSLASLPLLTQLYLGELSDGLMSEVSGLAQLRTLSLLLGSVTESGLAQLDHLPFLETLVIEGGDPAFPINCLTRFPALRTLHIDVARDTSHESEILAIARLPTMEEIFLDCGTVRPEAVGMFASLGYRLQEIGPSTLIWRRGKGEAHE